MTQAAETLRAAKALIDTPKKWTQHALARLGDDQSCFSHDPNAVCFCIIGAISRAESDVACSIAAFRIASNTLLHLTRSLGFHSVGDFNDHPDTSHTNVMALFDRAIALAEGKSA